MRTQANRGVPPEEHPRHKLIANWESVRLFLEVARSGSFRSAADRTDHSLNALRRRIADLERQLGATLLTRHVDGVRMTPEGEQILAAAERMEAASFDLARVRDQVFPYLSGEVHVAVTEGLGAFWLAPRLVELQRAHPRLLIDLSCAMRSADVLRLEADVAIQLTKPTAPDLKLTKLGRLHSMPFASRSYIDTYGTPTSIRDLLNHRLVLQVAEQTAMQETYDRLLPGVPQVGLVAMRTNVSSAHYWAIAKGAGIGWLPTYATAIGARAVPLDLELRFSFDIWITYHPNANKIPRIRRVIDWVISSFSTLR